MLLVYIFILIAFSNSYKIIDLEPYRYEYYMDDFLKTEDKAIIYRFVPKSTKRNIYISFIGFIFRGSFDFYLYSDISDIGNSEDGTFTNYLQKFENHGEYQIDPDYQSLEIFYILAKINTNDLENEKIKYFCFMMSNSEESVDLSKYNEYNLAIEGSRDIIFDFPATNIINFFYIELKADCENLTYYLYKNNTEPELIIVQENAMLGLIALKDILIKIIIII